MNNLSVNIIAVRERIVNSSPGDILENPDKILARNNQSVEIYKDFLSNAHVAACVQSRKSPILKMKWQVTLGDTSASPVLDLINSCLKSLKLRTIISEMLDAPLYGYKPVEIYWDYVNGYLIPADIKGKPPHWFHFDNNNLLRFKDKSDYSGLLVPPRKFLILQHNASYDNPYGESILSKCYYEIQFKRGAFKLWALFAERYGMPFVHGKTQTGADDEEQIELYKGLNQLKQEGIIVTEEETQLELIEGNKSSSSDTYERLINMCNAEISKAILSHIGTTESTPGKLGNDDTAEKVREDVVNADKALVEEAFNTLIQYICDLNFSGITEYPIFELYDIKDVDEKLAKRDTDFLNTGKIKFKEAYWKRNYGLLDDEFELIDQPAAQSPAFAEINTVNSNDKKEEPFDLEQFDDMTKKIIGFVSSKITEKQSYNLILDQLMDLYPNIDTSDLEEKMSTAILLAQTGAYVK